MFLCKMIRTTMSCITLRDHRNSMRAISFTNGLQSGDQGQYIGCTVSRYIHTHTQRIINSWIKPAFSLKLGVYRYASTHSSGIFVKLGIARVNDLFPESLGHIRDVC